MKHILLTALIGFLMVEIILLLFGFISTWIDWIAIGIFVLFVKYDFAKSEDSYKNYNNAILIAADLYLDVMNLFLRSLNIKKDD